MQLRYQIDRLVSGAGPAILDVFWPLSRLGMFVIGIKIAMTARWRGALRWWPLIAVSWAVVTVPSIGIFGQSAGDWVGATHR